MSERVIGKKSAQQMRAEVDAWQEAVGRLGHNYELGDQYHTAASLAEKYKVDPGTARRWIEKLVKKGEARFVGCNQNPKAGVYELIEKKR